MRTSISFKLAKIARKAGYNFKSNSNSAVLEMQKSIKDLGISGIQFSISINKDGSWFAESTNVQGLISGGQKSAEINDMLKDAIFTYYGIDAKHCDDRALKSSGEHTTVKQKVYVAS